MIWRWLPSLAWMGFIFWSSAQEGPSDFPVPDYLSHFVVYGILASLYFFALIATSLAAVGRFLVGMVLTASYGWSDELHQSLVPGRDPSAVDLAVDTLAAICALGIWELASRGRLRLASKKATDEPA